MGRTDRDVPGSLNAAESAAEVPEGEVDEDEEEACPSELGLAPTPLAGLAVETSVVEAAEAIDDDDSAEAGDDDDVAKVDELVELVDDEGAAEEEAVDVLPMEDVCESVQRYTRALVLK